jgi:aspartokinase
MNTKEFEKKPGVNQVDVRHGLAQAHIHDLAEPVMDERLRVLQAVADAEISIDFLKLTENGMAFIVLDELATPVQKVLTELGVKNTVWSGLSTVLVHAVNMRDEEGLIAGIVQQAVSGGGRLSHIGDMHDRLLLVVETEGAERIAEQFRSSLMEAQS